MNRTKARLLLLLPWLSVPLVVTVHLALWDRIPVRLATHFDLAGEPNGWMTRGQSLGFDLAVLLFVLVSATPQVLKLEPQRRLSRLVVLNLSVLFVTLVFLGLLKYNVTGSLF